MALFARELLTPFLRKEQPSLKRTAQEAADEYWNQYGAEAKTYTDWLNVRKQFRSQAGNIPVVIRGGGRAAMWTAEKILKAVPNAHVALYDEDAVLGGMARRAISSLLPGHAPAKTGALRDAIKLLVHPRLDVVSKTVLSTDRFAGMVRAHDLPIAIDAPGAVPARGAYPYGERVWDIMDMVKNINGPFDEDGHFKNVTLPVSRTPQGRRLPRVSVIGGNTGRDAQVALSLVDTVRDIAETYGVPIEDVNEAAILEHGIVKTRNELHLSKLDDRYIYRRPIGEMAGVKKLFKQTSKLERGDKALAEILTNGILGPDGWQEREGGVFIGSTDLESIEDDGQKIRAHMRNNQSGDREVMDGSTALISTGFTAGEPFRVHTGNGPVGEDVGMKVSGGGDLVSTMKSVTERAPHIIHRLTEVGSAYPTSAYSEWMHALEADQQAAGTVSIDGVHSDPILWTLEHGPKHMTQREFIGFSDVERSEDMQSSLPITQNAEV